MRALDRLLGRRPGTAPAVAAAPAAADVPGRARALALGLTAGEYELIVARIGREPVEVELAMFSLLWSEHCSYKHSKPLLRTLPTEGARLVMGPGENAGAVDVGGGLAVAFKVESHNHPSAVEPVSGSTACSGCGIRPSTLPASLTTPAMSLSEPLGFSPGA